jgi:hypothetical protein
MIVQLKQKGGDVQKGSGFSILQGNMDLLAGRPELAALKNY